MTDKELDDIEQRAKTALAAHQAVGQLPPQALYDVVKLADELRKARKKLGKQARVEA